MKTKTAELTGAALDWAVAECEKHPSRHTVDPFDFSDYFFNPSTAWAQGGPIIEREEITVSQGSPVKGLEWMACDRVSTHIQHGPTYLIAAMRCYCYAKLGNEIDIPEELCQQQSS